MLQDFAETLLPPVLARFSQMRPGVEMEVQVDRSTTLLERLLRKELDLVLLFERERGSGIGLGRVPMRWIVPRRRIDQEPMPLVLFEAPCVFRETALRRLKECRKPWRQSFASPSLAGLWAAVEAGLGISLRTPIGLPNTLEMVDRLPGTRALPMVEVVLHRSTEAASAAVGELAETIEAELTPRLG
jgi:DNA-binding transcriptional LysR family regulator